MNTPRISKDEYYLGIAREVARRSTCATPIHRRPDRPDDQIVSTGYAGAPRKTRTASSTGSAFGTSSKSPTASATSSAGAFTPSRTRSSTPPGGRQPASRRHVYFRERPGRPAGRRFSLFHLQKNDHQRRPGPNRLFHGRRRLPAFSSTIGPEPGGRETSSMTRINTAERKSPWPRTAAFLLAAALPWPRRPAPAKKSFKAPGHCRLRRIHRLCRSKTPFQLHTLLTEQRHPKTWMLGRRIAADTAEGLRMLFGWTRTSPSSSTASSAIRNSSARSSALRRRSPRRCSAGGRSTCTAAGPPDGWPSKSSALRRPFWGGLKKNEPGLWAKCAARLDPAVEDELIGEMTGADRALISRSRDSRIFSSSAASSFTTAGLSRGTSSSASQGRGNVIGDRNDPGGPGGPESPSRI